ncbi:MAG: hypothetical protein JJ863_24855 [Deltaproteobacteria bacterium]|nr:hypothetical protein [Deltaproteobacteria bacterium]
MLVDLDDPDAAKMVADQREERRAADADLSERTGMVLFGFAGAIAGFLVSAWFVSGLTTHGGSASFQVLFGPPILGGAAGILLGRFVPIGRRARRVLVVGTLVAAAGGWWWYRTAEEARRERLDADLRAWVEESRADERARRAVRERCGYEFDQECRDEVQRLLRDAAGTEIFDPEGSASSRRIARGMLRRGCELGDAWSCDRLER